MVKRLLAIEKNCNYSTNNEYKETNGKISKSFKPLKNVYKDTVLFSRDSV